MSVVDDSERTEVEVFKSEAWMRKSSAKSYAVATNVWSLSSMSVIRYLEWLEELHPNAKVLDVGAGTGALTTALARNGVSVTALDVSQQMLDQIPRSRRVEKVVGNVLEPSLGLPQGSEKYSAIVSRWVLPHFPSWPDIIRNMSDLLLPDGSIFVDFPNPDHFRFLRESTSRDESAVGYDFSESANAYSYYRAPSRSEVEAAAASAGMVVTDVRPASFLASNALLADPAPLGLLLAEALRSRRGRRLVKDLDRELAASLPDVLCGLLIYRLTWKS